MELLSLNDKPKFLCHFEVKCEERRALTKQISWLKIIIWVTGVLRSTVSAIFKDVILLSPRFKPFS